MASYINTNIASLNSQRNLTASQSGLATSLQRLSSGLRINSAKDDAAGLAISSRFTTQIRGIDQAARNANDGISLAQTAEGALGEISNNLQRIRELAVQAANSTNSASDRATINQEVQQRLAEIDRTGSQTSFNGQKILDGSFGPASFQVGANVGETISLDLSSSMRTGAIGGIAATTSTAFGASAVNGSVTTGAISGFDFRAASAATGGSYAVSPTTMLFTSTTSAGNGGALAVTGMTSTDFADAGAAAVKASNTQSFTGTTDFSGANLAQFDVTIGTTTVGVTLNAAYADADAVAAAIESQLAAVVTGTTVTNTSGQFKIEALTSETVLPISVGNVDTNAGLHGFAASAGIEGAAAGAGAAAASFKVDGTTITLNADYTDQAGVAAAIQTQLQADVDTANYSVSIGAAGEFEITNNTIGSAAVAITANGTLLDGGWVTAGTAGTSTTGVAAVSNKDAKLLVDGQSITLDSNYSSFTAMASGLQAKIQALGGAFANYTVANTNGELKISKGNADQTAVVIAADPSATTNQAANAVASGLLAGSGAAGATAITSSNASFTVDGTTISLDANYSNLAGLASAINSKLQAGTGTSTYTATVDGSGIKFTGTASNTAVSVSGLTGSATGAGFAALTGTGGVSAGSLNLAAFSITTGSNQAVDLSGGYANGQELVDAINSRVSGVSASLDAGKLVLSSSSDIVLSGSSATASAGAGGLGFAATTISADQGALSTVNTLTIGSANESIQRLDSALAAVNSLRSTFGAAQNRFDSVISNLSSSSENLAAARSRIQDADFAAETAALTRNQILQQAGTAMLAQANSLPNGVLALLRG